MDLTFILKIVYFYLPGAVANMGAVLAKFVPGFRDIKRPVDGGMVMNGHRLIGEHKTWGGVGFGMVTGICFGLLQFYWLNRIWPWGLVLDLDLWRTLVLSLLLSFGALAGDLSKSVLKRLLGVAPHKAWIPFDEIDHTVFAMTLVKIVFNIEWIVVWSVIVIFFFIHIVTNVIAFYLKIKKVPY